MKTLYMSLVASAFSLVPVVSAVASPVAGFEGLYEANYTACVLPTGTLEDCEAAIGAHVAALVGGNVSESAASVSFTALRSEVFAANAADEVFQLAIDALFELLLPDSGAIVGLGDGDGAPGSGGSTGRPDADPDEISND